MTNLIVAVGCVLAVSLVLWNIARVRRFQRDYQYDGEIPCVRYECDLRDSAAESPMRCLIGATESALYLASPEDQRRRKWWQSWGDYRAFHRYYKANLRIPWTDLEFRATTVLFKEVIWFENRSKRFYIYVPRAIGEKVLADAGREIPI